MNFDSEAKIREYWGIEEYWDKDSILNDFDHILNDNKFKLSKDFIREFADKFDENYYIWELIFWYSKFDDNMLEELVNKPSFIEYFEQNGNYVPENILKRFPELFANGEITEVEVEE